MSSPLTPPRTAASMAPSSRTAVSSASSSRTVVLWCPDWPVVAAGIAAQLPAQRPAAVIAANRVVACSAVARAAGVSRGLRRREAQARCPDLVVHPADRDRDARLFEPVVAAVEQLAPGVEVVRPGVVALTARGPTRYFGGEPAVAERLVDHVAAVTGVESQVGIADGLFAATLAAHRGVVVAVDRTRAFLAPLSAAELCRDPGIEDDARPGGELAVRTDLVDLLYRLGIRSLGDFAALPASAVASRFGASATTAHRLAAGRQERPVGRRDPPPDLVVTVALDPPVDRVDAAAFAARSAATRLTGVLADRGLACTRLGIQAVTEAVADGARDELTRVWRCAEPLTAAATADRVRWQLEGWLTAAAAGRAPSGRAPAGRVAAGPSGPVVLLRLVPEEVVPAGALQLGLWGETGESDERAGRALVRVQTLLGGPDTVLTAVLDGGRAPADRVRLVPWGDARTPLRDPALPWPGRLPEPSPAVVLLEPVPVGVFDIGGVPVSVTDRLVLSAAPATVRVTGPAGTDRRVLRWAGPWPVQDRWWDPVSTQRSVRLQAVLDAPTAPVPVGPPAAAPDTAPAVAPVTGRPTDTGRGGHLDLVPDPTGAGEYAVLLLARDGRWWVEAVYD